MDNSPHNDLAPGSQWSADDLALMRKLAHKRTRKAELRLLFPGRSLGAIKNQLTQQRRALGIAKPMPVKAQRGDDAFTMLDPDDPGLASHDYQMKWAKNAAIANQKYLAALARAA